MLQAVIYMRIETFTTNTFTMDYFRFGHGKKNLVILPGLSVQRVMDAADAIANAYHPLTEDFTIYVMERRNELPPEYSIQAMAQDTAEVLNGMGLGAVCLLGTSQGGMMAMEIALKHPALVQKLILASTSAYLPQAAKDLFRHWVNLAKAGNAAELYLSFGEAIYPKTVFDQAREQLIHAAATVTYEDLRRFIIMANDTTSFNVMDELDRISCPVLVIGSKDDHIFGADTSLQIAEHFKGRPGCDCFMYDGYGHAVYDIAPDYKNRIHRYLMSDK